MNKLNIITAALTFMCAATSCQRIDDDRLPPVAVNVVFTTPGVWALYGVGGALEWKRFIRTRTLTVPADFPYTAASYTGFGGLLLVGDLYGNPLAYDLACPYEARADVRVEINPEANDARCPVCHSTYDVFGGQGRPTSGPAAQRGYGLTRYRVAEGSGALDYRMIIR